MRQYSTLNLNGSWYILVAQHTYYYGHAPKIISFYPLPIKSTILAWYVCKICFNRGKSKNIQFFSTIWNFSYILYQNVLFYARYAKYYLSEMGSILRSCPIRDSTISFYFGREHSEVSDPESNETHTITYVLIQVRQNYVPFI